MPNNTTQQPASQITFDQVVVFISQNSGLSVPIILMAIIFWKKIGEPWFDTYIKPNISNLTRSYRTTNKISDRVQTIRNMTASHRALLMEIDRKNNSIVLISQELMDGGIALIDGSYKQKESECVQNICKRFDDHAFICREVALINSPLYRGYLQESGIYFVIYQKVLESKDKTWILALHYREEFHVNYITAQSLESQIKEQCDAIASLLQQNSVIDGFIKNA
jgi:hypothetical protein